MVGLASCCRLALTAFVCPLEPRTQDRQRDVDGEDGGEGASEHSSCQEHQEEAPRWTVPGWCLSGGASYAVVSAPWREA